MKTRSALIVVVMLGLAVRAQADVVYDAHSEFNSTSNTSSNTWQYMTTTTYGTNGGYTLMPVSLFGQTDPPVSTVRAWGIDSAWTAPYIADWTVSGTPDVKPAGLYFDLELALGAATTPSGVLAWKSPTAGYATVHFDLTGGPTAVSNTLGDGMTYALFAGTETTARATGLATGSSAATVDVANIPVSAGTMLYLQFGSGANSWGDDFRCDLTVTTSVPEPSSIAILGSALVGLLAYAWRKRR